MNNMGKMMKQIQKMQADLVRVQEELKDKTVEATSGGGAVKVTANGHQELIALEIAPEAVDPADREMLQDLILAAVNEVLRKSRDMAAEEMARVTSGIAGLPGMPQIL